MDTIQFNRKIINTKIQRYKSILKIICVFKFNQNILINFNVCFVCYFIFFKACQYTIAIAFGGKIWAYAQRLQSLLENNADLRDLL